MLKLTGYSDRIYVRPGQTIEFKINCDGPKTYQADIVRLICGDTNPDGPGFREKLVRTDVSKRYKGRKQVIHAGSRVIIPDSEVFDRLDSFTVQAMIWPTTPDKGEQGLVVRGPPRERAGFALIIDANGAIALRIADGKRMETISTGRKLLERHWYFIGASFDAKTRRVRVFQEPLESFPGVPDGGTTRRAVKVRGPGSIRAPLVMASIPTRISGDQVFVTGLYNGKLDSPRLASRVLDAAEMEALKTGLPASLETDILAAWDFSLGIGTEQISDISPNRLDGTTLHMPARAMTGWNWDGETMDWKVDPGQWGAMHFHDDDVYDAAWETDFSLTVPARMKSGLYAARLRAGRHEEYIPFAVSPEPGKEKKIAFLLPTASYMAYANHHVGCTGATELQNGCVALYSPQDVFLHQHREYGMSPYDTHSDGSGVCYTSRLRPVLNMRPKYQSVLGGFKGSSLWQFNADTHLVDWLDAMKFGYDVITDEELHDRGLELLEPYRAVLTGSHPEYWSPEMWEGLDAWKRRGGRFMYMGGNGFYWKVAFSAATPGIMEVRRSETGIRSWPAAPGEFYNSQDGGYGGLWLRNGKPPQIVGGTGFSTQGFDLSSYYVRQPDSFKEKVRFIFKGVGKDERIGDFGLLGGGAAGLELDRAAPELGTPPNTFMLATSVDHTDIYRLVPEEFLETAPGLGGQECPLVRADMVFFETPNNGAVFSTSSIAWCGSLAHNNYRNNVSRITKNVLERFLDPNSF